MDERGGAPGAGPAYPPAWRRPGRDAEALDIGAELLAAGARTGNLVATLAGHQTSGVPLLYSGRFAAAEAHLTKSLAVARTLPAAVLERFPQNVEIGSTIFLALTVWVLGDPTAQRPSSGQRWRPPSRPAATTRSSPA